FGRSVAGEVHEGDAGQSARRRGGRRDAFGGVLEMRLVVALGRDPLCTFDRLVERHVIKVAHGRGHAEAFGMTLVERGALADERLAGRVGLEQGSGLAGEPDEGEYVVFPEGRHLQGAPVRVADVRAALKVVRVVGAELLRDPLRHAERGTAGADGDLHAGFAPPVHGLPYAVAHLGVRADDGAVEVEDDEGDHGETTAKPSSSSCSAATGAGAPVRGSSPRWIFGNAIVSRMEDVPASSI